MQPSHSALSIAYSKKAHEHSRSQEKAEHSSLDLSAAAEERARALRRHADSIQDLVVEKWVDLPTSQAAVRDQESRNRASGSSPLKSTRFNPTTSSSARNRNKDSKENRKTRSSTSVVALSPHKRDMVRNALLKYRHYFLKSPEGAGSRGLNTPAGVAKVGPAVPRELLIAYVLFKHAHLFKRDRALCDNSGQSQVSLEPRNQEANWCYPTGGDGGALTATTGKDMFDELERTRERLSKTTIEDDYDMVDQ